MNTSVLRYGIPVLIVPVIAMAQNLHEMRKKAEQNTESRIYEKLEEARLRDEKNRASRLFGHAKAPKSVKPQTVYIQKVGSIRPKALVSKSQEKVEAVPESVNTVDVIRKKERFKGRYYIGANTGISEYKQAKNLENQYSAGVLFGGIFDNDLIAEAGFMYSQFYVDTYLWSGGEAVYTDLDQYNFTFAAKYAPIFSEVSPQVGAILSYTHRKYNGVLDGTEGSSESDRSGVIDLGLTAGVDFELTDEFILGGEFKYMWNLTTDSDSRVDSVFEGESPETSDYYNFSISAKFVF